MELQYGSIDIRVKGDALETKVSGKFAVPIVREEEEIPAEPFQDALRLSVSEFMDILFVLYGVEDKVVLNKGKFRVEVGRKEHPFLRFTDFETVKRSVFYLKGEDFSKVLSLLSVVKCELPRLEFTHTNGDNAISVVMDRVKGELHFLHSEESEVLYGQSLIMLKEIIRGGLTDDLGFLTFGAGKFSLIKPSGRISIGGVYKDRGITTNFILAQGRSVPKLTAKVYLCVR